MTTTQVILAVVGAVLSSGVVAAIVTGLFSKKRMSAEAADIITKAASGVVVSIESELLRQRTDNERQRAEHEAAMIRQQESHESKMQALVDSHNEEMEEVRRVLQLHVAWDAIAIAKMAEFDVILPPAPPLLPARRFDHPDEVH